MKIFSLFRERFLFSCVCLDVNSLQRTKNQQVNETIYHHSSFMALMCNGICTVGKCRGMECGGAKDCGEWS